MDGSKRKNNRGKKKKKIELVFDPQARREFLTGFHKRKLERKVHFQEELKKQMKEERRRIKQKAKESYKTMVKSHQTIPEIEHLLKEEHDLGSHSVEIVELSTQELAKQNNWIGANDASYADQKELSEDEDEDDVESDPEEIPGMGLKLKLKKKVKEEEQEPTEDSGPVFKTAKELKKVIKKEAAKSVKKSKAYQMKNKLDKHQSKKKSMQMNKRNTKKQEKGKKGKKMKKASAIRGSKMAMAAKRAR